MLRLHREAQFDEIEVISRHPLIGSHAADFAEASGTQFSMSFDTLDPVLHDEICSGGPGRDGPESGVECAAGAQWRYALTDPAGQLLLAGLGRHPHTTRGGALDGTDREIVRWALDVTRASALADRPVSELSDGEASGC